MFRHWLIGEGVKGGALEVFVKVSQILGPLATACALIFVVRQSVTAREQLALQTESANRTWAAQQLVVIFDQSRPLAVREEAVKAYLAIQEATHKRVNLRYGDLSRMNLSGVCFSSKDRTTDLTDTIFNGTDLQGAFLTGADLTRARFEAKADLSGAHLESSTLEGSTFFDATLRNTHFNDSILWGASFSQFDQASGQPESPADASGADFGGVRVSEKTYWCGVTFRGAKFDNAEGLTRAHEDCITAGFGSRSPQPP